MNRRKLFSFLATSPVVAVGAIAKAAQPIEDEITVKCINFGDYFRMILNKDGSVKMERISKPYNYISFIPD